MKRNNLALLSGLLGLLCVAAALGGCGFDCDVRGTTQHFASCEDLQEAYDNEQASLNPPPDNAILDDLDTCGVVNGCEVQP